MTDNWDRFADRRRVRDELLPGVWTYRHRANDWRKVDVQVNYSTGDIELWDCSMNQKKTYVLVPSGDFQNREAWLPKIKAKLEAAFPVRDDVADIRRAGAAG